MVGCQLIHAKQVPSVRENWEAMQRKVLFVIIVDGIIIYTLKLTGNPGLPMRKKSSSMPIANMEIDGLISPSYYRGGTSNIIQN